MSTEKREPLHAIIVTDAEPDDLTALFLLLYHAPKHSSFTIGVCLRNPNGSAQIVRTLVEHIQNEFGRKDLTCLVVTGLGGFRTPFQDDTNKLMPSLFQEQWKENKNIDEKTDLQSILHTQTHEAQPKSIVLIILAPPIDISNKADINWASIRCVYMWGGAFNEQKKKYSFNWRVSWSATKELIKSLKENGVKFILAQPKLYETHTKMSLGLCKQTCPIFMNWLATSRHQTPMFLQEWVNMWSSMQAKNVMLKQRISEQTNKPVESVNLSEQICTADVFVAWCVLTMEGCVVNNTNKNTTRINLQPVVISKTAHTIASSEYDSTTFFTIQSIDDELQMYKLLDNIGMDERK